MSETIALNKPLEGDIVDGKYKLVKTLGEGGFGLVFQAEHIELRDKFAIKFYWPKGNLHGEKEKDRFLLEGRALRRIKSEYAVHVSDMGRFSKYDGGNQVPYIVLDYLEGTDLHAYVGNHPPLPVPQAIDFMLQACIALAKAHAMRIIHRDLKPANLFLTEQDGVSRVKVLDFGLAKDAATDAAAPNGAKTDTFQIIGTPAYMAPEQWGGLKKATHLSDVFALGVCLFHLLTGREPFEGQDAGDIQDNIRNHPPFPIRSFRQDISDPLAETIERAFKKKPEERYPSVVAFARALVPFGDERAAHRLQEVERAAEAGKRAAERMDEERITVPLSPSSPPEDPTKQYAHRKNSPPQQGGTAPLGVPRQTTGRFLLVGTVLLALTLVFGLIANQILRTPEAAPLPSATTTPSAAPSPSIEHVAPPPSSTPPAPSASVPSTSNTPIKAQSGTKPKTDNAKAF